MDSKYNPKQFEEKIYKFWEENKFFEAKINPIISGKKKPFSIILPPPNANADLHLGHAMYVYEDIMIRYYKLKGFETLWLAGADHAGFETQYVFEKHLRKEEKTRFDYDRDTLFKMVWDFVMKNRNNMESQLKKLGFALDWSKKKFTMDEDIVKIVYDTFKKLFDKKLVYRAKKLVNYCTFCGTSFSDLEVVYKEKQGKLYYIKYPLAYEKNKFIVVATTRPETLLGDTAVAVNAKDKRYKDLIGKEVIIPFVNRKIKIISDSFVDQKFGTGVVKITPAHDFNDFEIGKKHNLEMIQVIDFSGKMNKNAGIFEGLYVKQAREKIFEELKKMNLIEKIEENYKHRVGTCYKCGNHLEPLPKEQWFIKIKLLAQKAKEKVIKEKIKIYPKRFKKILLWWLDNFSDWNISRQIVWGIRIPAYRCKLKTQNLKIKNNEERWFVSIEKPEKCQICGNCDFEQDTDTFDTWFSSGQWPFATLMSCSKLKIKNEKLKIENNKFFKYFYPTSVMETGYDILPWWVARMIMLGVFYTGKEPFKTIYLHGLVRDKHGQKMSKSKGNVINPMKMIDKYGADALRASLVFEVKTGGDISFSEERIIGMRNFANKIWNIGRFIYINKTQSSNVKTQNYNLKLKTIYQLKKELKEAKRKYFKLMDNYHFSQAFGLLYDFIWHRIADFYIEELKKDIFNGNINTLNKLKEVYLESLKMLHPFMPFITEAVFKVFNNNNENSILLTSLAS